MKEGDVVSIEQNVNEYYSQVSEQETRFRDLFSKEELKEARREYYTRESMRKTWLEFLKEETGRKLREQDGD